MSSSPPAVVADRYRLVAPLGQGGMGRVWRATDVVLHRDVAIKELVPPPGLTPGERQEMRERSLREARAIARLNNINVVRVFDVLRTDADPWIVMEYVPSRSLQDTLAADGPFSPVRAAEIGLGVLGALRAAHRAGVVHRDVKPGNVLLGADGRVVLTDFGLATVPGDPNVTRTGLVLGSPAYIAPERARDGTAGPAADLWSLGATLYAAVEGTSPFARPSAIATLAALATENPPPARNAGPLKPVLNGLLRKDPTHRINAEEAERLLNRAAGRRSKLAFPMSPTMRRPGAGRDRPSGLMAPTGSTPVVPGPRPPVVPARPVDPPGRPPVSGGRPAAGGGRPPVYIPGKAQVGPAETPTRVDGPKVDAPRLDATRVDTPPVRDDRTAKISGTSRGGAGGLTAADVAANRRRQAAPEHEQSLADATALVGRIDTAPADATTVVGGPAADATRVVSGPAADATRVVSGPATDAAGVVGSPADATTVVDAPKKGAQKSRKAPTKANPANAKPTKAGPAQAKATTEAATATSAPVEVEATPVETKATTTEKTSAEAETAEAKSAEVKAAEAKPAETDPTDAEPPESLTGAQAVETEVAEPVSEEADAPATDKDAETGEAKAIADTPDAGTLGKSTTAAEPEADQQSKSQDGTKPQDETKGEDETKAEPEAEAATPIGPATAPAPEGPDTPGDPNPVSPAIGRSTRPAWRPMEVAPARRGGVTVFGTRLTYPQAAVGAGVLLLVLVLIG
ncbi:MAG TPA: protein kinase, partial [Actinoplanes sp.]|nr:protein kinase [Actinoplanes sp.]